MAGKPEWAGPPAHAGPAEKATGNVTLYEPYDGGYRVVDFNAHEAKENREAKGEMTDYVYDPDDNLRRIFEYDVHYVNVDGDYAHFGALCTYDSEDGLTGQWLYVKVLDGGTPGTEGDAMGWRWGSESQVEDWVNNGGATGWWRTPIAGNLVVHN
ncbi:MAG: hypothetical protein ACP5FL_08905, partial [Thermoplasmatota archaeon]